MDKHNTFVVSILYTQNSSWQGSVDWITKEGTKTQCFRSALELIRLIDSAVESTGQKDWQEKLPEDSGYAR
jgi:hypothetical protein